jgi:hypothetical protein
MDIVADLNNQGIECLKDGRIYDGLENFAQALVICEQLSSSVEREEQKKNHCFVLSNAKVTPWILTSADLSVDLEEQGNFTYCKAITDKWAQQLLRESTFVQFVCLCFQSRLGASFIRADEIFEYLTTKRTPALRARIYDFER